MNTPKIDTKTDNVGVLNAEKGESAKNSSIDFFRSFIEHIKVVFDRFRERSNLSNVNNDEYVELGRAEDEKRQIMEMCDRVDEESQLLAELNSSKLTPEDWLQKKTEDILQDCTPEEREDIIQLVQEEDESGVIAQADALEETIDAINVKHDTQEEE